MEVSLKNVLVATRDIAANERLTAAHVEFRLVPQERLSTFIASRFGEVDQFYAARNITAGELIDTRTIRRTADVATQRYVPFGHQPVTIQLRHESLANRLEENQRLNVMLQSQTEPGRSGRVVLENAGIHSYQDGRPGEMPTVTLLLDAHDRDRLTQAAQEGVLQLALANEPAGGPRPMLALTNEPRPVIAEPGAPIASALIAPESQIAVTGPPELEPVTAGATARPLPLMIDLGGRPHRPEPPQSTTTAVAHRPDGVVDFQAQAQVDRPTFDPAAPSAMFRTRVQE